MSRSLQKVAWVTGASSGFGALIALELAKEGYYVYASARRIEKLSEIQNDNIQPLPLDVTDEAACEQAMQHIMHEKGRVDVLVNNAGYGLMCPIEDASMHAIQAQFDVNVFACVKLMQLVTPVMREQNFGLIINMSSVVGHVSMPLIGFYAASKHALEAISDSARNELYKFGIHVVLVEPGAIQTEFEDVAFSQMDKAIQTDVYKPLAQKLKKLSNMKYARAPKAAAVANVVQKIVTTNKPKKRYKVGLDAHFMIPIKNILGDNIIDPILRFLLRTK